MNNETENKPTEETKKQFTSWSDINLRCLPIEELPELFNVLNERLAHLEDIVHDVDKNGNFILNNGRPMTVSEVIAKRAKGNENENKGE